MKTIKCELCAYSVEACRTAARLGVDRVELCASPTEGGVTPSIAAIEQVSAIEGIDVSVMIRPRGGDFLYSDDDLKTILRDISHVFYFVSPCFVIFIIIFDCRVYIKRTRLLVEAASGMETTFHRAVDMTADYPQAIEDIIATGCTRILTSGGHDKAVDGIDAIAQAVAIAAGRIEIMAGSGVAANNALQLATTGIDALHFSAKRIVAGGMKYRNPRISMGGTESVDEFALRTVDEEEVRKILSLVREQTR